jgi:hypothetical protein
VPPDLAEWARDLARPRAAQEADDRRAERRAKKRDRANAASGVCVLTTRRFSRPRDP